MCECGDAAEFLFLLKGSSVMRRVEVIAVYGWVGVGCWLFQLANDVVGE